jgi:hypothetical protein
MVFKRLKCEATMTVEAAGGPKGGVGTEIRRRERAEGLARWCSTLAGDGDHGDTGGARDEPRWRAL